jgi:hypothetical protein
MCGDVGKMGMKTESRRSRSALLPEAHQIGTVGMFFLYFNKLGWLGSILISIVVTVVLVLALRSWGS